MMPLSRLVFRAMAPSRPVLRVGVYFTCVFVVLTMISARALFASAKEGAAAFGRELIGLGQLTGGVGGPRDVGLFPADPSRSKMMVPGLIGAVRSMGRRHAESGPPWAPPGGVGRGRRPLDARRRFGRWLGLPRFRRRRPRLRGLVRCRVLALHLRGARD